jgi:hypothetical protein
MDPTTGLIVGQCVAGVLFVVSELLGSTNCNYNSIFDLVMSVISGIFIKPSPKAPSTNQTPLL